MTRSGTEHPVRPSDTGPGAQGAVLGHPIARTEQQVAVKLWLLAAARDREEAREQWRQPDGIALLPCGQRFSAVRIPARVVWAALKTDVLRDVDERMNKWFDGGAVLMDLHSHMYYALVPSEAEWTWTDRECPGVGLLGGNSLLGIPAVQRTEPRGRAYWCMPMETPGDLCHLDEVEQLVTEGCRSLREKGAQ